MSSTYIHTKKKFGTTKLILKVLATIYFLFIAATIFYLWTVAQDRYRSTASFKIARQNDTGLDAGLVSLALPGLSDSGSMDSQIAIGYVASADFLLGVEKEYNLIEHYSSPKRDFVFRLDPSWTLEDRLEYYRGRIFAHFDKETGLTALTVDTFDPELSHKIAVDALQKAEAFINNLNHNVANQQLEFVSKEVNRTTERVMELNRELIALQNENRFISPGEVISASMSAVQQLQLDHLKGEADLATVLRDSPDSPQIEPLRSRLRSLKELIEIETAKLSGPDRDRLNQVLLRFNELQMKIEFANRIRAGAQTMLEKNRMEAAAHSRFFSVIQKPFLPEDVALPRRPYATVSIIVIAILLFLVARALTHSVFEA
ncbi:MAG: hypothetical protein EOP84_21045 [Verrucomicrobiaceae bacterium]|nr:MAG: hypothetical protein EOP84_21045 [Verrucomicrobiaceae bacterium]